MWRKKYMMRVAGLGTVEALFLPHAVDDTMALRDLHTCESCDPRMKVVALYRIEQLALETSDRPTARSGADIYLQTGIPDEAKGAIVNLFYERADDAVAWDAAKNRRWHESCLYRCNKIPIL